MITTEIVATKGFQTTDGPLHSPQLVGFWDASTAVMFGYGTDEFRLAEVGLAAVLITHPAFGASLSSAQIPDQFDADLGPYGEPTPSQFIAFCPISPTQAILVSKVATVSADNPFNVVGEKGEVFYHLMTRATPTSVSFAFSEGTLAGTAWSWPQGAVDFGSGSAEDYACDVLQAIVGPPETPMGFVVSMTRPGPSREVQYMGPVSTVGTTITVGASSLSLVAPTQIGRAIPETGQAPLNESGAWVLYGGTPSPRLIANGLEHSDPVQARTPQIVGTYTTDSGDIVNDSGARLAWGTVESDGVHFHSVDVGVAPVGKYGLTPVALPTGVVAGNVVDVALAPGCSNAAYVPVTLVVSDAQLNDTTWSLSGTATVYGAVVDFRGVPGLRSDWQELASYDYRDLPSRPSLSATLVNDTEIDLEWSPATGGAPVGGMTYDLYRSGILVASDIGGTSYADTDRVPSTHYEYVLVAHDSAGNYGPASVVLGVTTTGPDAEVDTTPPSAPTLSIVSHDAHSVRFRVDGSSDNVAISHYRIFMTGHIVDGHLVDDADSFETPLSVENNGDGTYTVDWATTNTGAGDHQPYFALDGQPHYYCARAYDTSGNESARSDYAACGPVTLATTAHPSGTGDPNVTSTSGVPKTGITFTWGEPTEIGGSLSVVTDIYRSGVLIATVPAATVSYTDTFVAHTQPAYQLQARDSAGNLSAMSNPQPNWTVIGD